MKKMIMARKFNRYIIKRRQIRLSLKNSLLNHFLILILRLMMKIKKAHPKYQMKMINSHKILKSRSINLKNSQINTIKKFNLLVRKMKAQITHNLIYLQISEKIMIGKELENKLIIIKTKK